MWSKLKQSPLQDRRPPLIAVSYFRSATCRFATLASWTDQLCRRFSN